MQLNGNLKPAVFLDRDGVINAPIVIEGKPYSPRNMKEVRVLEGVRDAIPKLHNEGFELIVVTNQPDIANGFVTREFVDEIHSFLRSETGIKHFYVCVHNAEDECVCRKPKSGLLRKAALDLKLDLSSSFLVGDRWKDVEAGQDAGCKCFFIDNKYEEKRPKLPFLGVNSLLEATSLILEALYADER